MGCAAAKEVAAVGDAQRQEVVGGDGDAQVHDVMDRERRAEIAARKPHTLEVCWVAGAHEANDQAPHFIPRRGPMSLREKLPPCTASLRRRVLVSLFVPEPPTTLSTLGDAAATVPQSGGQSPVALVATPIRHSSSSTSAANANTTLAFGGSTGRGRIRPVSGFQRIGNTSSRLQPQPHALFASSTAEKNSNLRRAYHGCIPRWFVGEPQLPSSERVLLEAAEGRLLTGGAVFSSSIAPPNNIIANAVPLPASSTSAVPPLGKPPLPLDSLHLQSASIDGCGFPLSSTMSLRAHYVLPDDSIVARAFFPHSLYNYSVGWVKVPAAPVVTRTTRDATTDAGVMIRNNIEGLVNVNPPERGENGGATDQHVVTVDESGCPQQTGFLSSSKPIYDVTIDGPVANPNIPADAAAAIGAGQINALRYLEKYFLYPRHIHAVCVTLSWKNAAAVDAPFQDVNYQHCLQFACDSGTPTAALKATRSHVLCGDGGDSLVAGHDPSLARPSVAGPVRGAASSSSGSGYFFALPVLRRSGGRKASTVTDDDDSAADGRGEIPSSLRDESLRSESSLPVLLYTPFSALHPNLHAAVVRVMEHDAMSQTTAVPQVPVTEAPGSSTATPSTLCAAAAALLSHDDISWLAFRWRLLEVLLSATSSIASGCSMTPRAHLLPTPVPVAHVAIKLGLKFHYNNREFIAFNEHGKVNHVNGMPPPGLTEESSLLFVDKQRSPAVELSATVSESQVFVLSARMQPQAASDATFTSSATQELQQIQFLFSHFFPDVKVL